MDKSYEAIKEILEDEIKKIVKKGDITPQDLDSLYKASAIWLDFETRDAMKKVEKRDGYSRDGESHDGYSTHYPWYMPGFRSYDGKHYFDNSNDMQSYGNDGHSMRNSYEHYPRGSYDDRGSYDEYSNGSSYMRGRDARTGRYVSRHSEREHMLSKLESMLDDASTERERNAIEQCIERISR